MTLTNSDIRICAVCHYTNPANAEKCMKCGTLLLPVTTIKVRNDAKLDSDDLVPSIKPRLGYVTVYLPSHNHSLHVKLKDQIVFGRSTGVDNPPDIDLTAYYGVQAGVSRRHASIKFSGETANIEDLGSSNGTWLNEVRLDPKQIKPLRSGDIIRLGNFLMFVYFTFSQKTEQTLILRDKLDAVENGLTETYFNENLMSFISTLQELNTIINKVMKREETPILIRKIEFDERANFIRVKLMETDAVIQFLRDKVIVNTEIPEELMSSSPSLETAVSVAASTPPPKKEQESENGLKPNIGDSVNQLLAKIAGNLSEDQLTQYQQQIETHIQKLLNNRLEVIRL